MSYIGRSPQIGGYHKLDQITCDGSTAYTMQLNSSNFSPESVNHMIVSVNGVIQAPTTSYTISASTITFASALTSSDTIDFIICLGNVLDIGVPSDNTVSLSKLTASGTKDATTFLRGDNTFAVPSGETNTPSFRAYQGSAQSVSNNTLTTLNIDTENFDTDSAFDTSTYTFTPQVAGKYFIFGGNRYTGQSNYDTGFSIEIRKNGSGVARNAHPLWHEDSWYIGTILELNGSTDYVNLTVYHSGGITLTIKHGQSDTFFGGFRLL